VVCRAKIKNKYVCFLKLNTSFFFLKSSNKKRLLNNKQNDFLSLDESVLGKKIIKS
jgi:hypothetical protein